MSNPSQLSDMQLVLLAGASQRDDGSLFPIPTALDAGDSRLDKALRSLVAKGAAAEIEVTKAPLTWRQEENRRIGLAITDVGRRAIAVEPVGGDSISEAPPADATPRKPSQIRPGTKQAQLVEMLEREGGATIEEITVATSWLAHTARAMLTGLRKRGHDIVSDKTDGVRRYRIAVEATAQ